jgi:excisionase family DNA binding protein
MSKTLSGNFDRGRELTVEEKASRLNLNPQTLYRKAKRGEIPCVRYGRSVRFYENDPPTEIPPQSIKLIGLPSLDLTEFDKMYLKKEVKMSSSKLTRWQYRGIGGVFIRPGKKRDFWYYWININGKRVIKAAKIAFTREEAVKVMVDDYNEWKRNHFELEERANEISFADFCDEFETRDASENEKYTVRLLKDYFRDKKLHQITFKDVEDYVYEKLETVNPRTGEKISRGTTNRHVGILRRMFNKAEKRGYRVPKNNPVDSSEHIKRVDSRDVTLTLEEEERLLKAADDNLKPIIVCALHTGMRKGEILSLEWTDVNLEYGRIHVKAEKSKTHQDRHIPIDNVLFTLLGTRRNQNGHSKYVFGYYNEARKKYSRYADIVKPFINAREKAGLNHVHFHDLRHTFATRCVQSGVDLFSLMKLLGHSNVDTTQRYVNMRDVDLSPAIDKLEKTFYPRVPTVTKTDTREKTTEIQTYAN